MEIILLILNKGTPELERPLRPRIALIHTGFCLFEYFLPLQFVGFATTFLFGEMILLQICDDYDKVIYPKQHVYNHLQHISVLVKHLQAIS